MIRAALFDLDGTLVDSLPAIAESLNHALQAHGWPPHPPQAVRSFIGDGSWWLARRALPAEAPDSAADATEALFKSTYATSWPLGTTPFPGVTALLADLHAAAIPIAVLSNKPDAFTVQIVARLFPAVPFALVRGEIPDVPLKPDPASALAIARTLNLPASAILFVGDSRVDADTASRAGMPCALVGWGYDAHARSGCPDASWCATLPELRALLLETSC